MITDFLRGVTYVPRGFRLLSTPGLKRYVWLPIIINVVVFVGLFWLGYDLYRDLATGILPSPTSIDPSAWEHSWWGEIVAALLRVVVFLLVMLQWLLLPLYLLAAAVIAFYTFTAVANLIGSPFNGMLAAQVERDATGSPPPDDPGGTGLAVEAVRAMGGEIRKQAYFLLLGVPVVLVFVLGWIFPPLHLLGAPLAVVYGAWIIGLEYLDYPLGNHGLGFREQRRLARQRRMLHLGFGAAVLAMTVVPGVNLLAMPTAVIGATLLQVEQERRRPYEPPSR